MDVKRLIYSIVVVDGDDNRRKALASLSGHCLGTARMNILSNSGVWYEFLAKDKREIKIDDKAYIPTSAMVALRHYRNEDEQLPFVPGVEIWYGGNGSENDLGKKWNIHAVLANKFDVENNLSEAAWCELMEWAINPKRDKMTIPFLLRPSQFELSFALIILCQGYLSAHFNPVERKEEIVNKAFQDIGLTSLEDSALIVTARVHAEQMTECNWWQDSLKCFSDDKQSINKAGLEKKLTEELAYLNVERTALARKLFQDILDGKKIDNVKLVAQAYLELSGILKEVI